VNQASDGTVPESLYQTVHDARTRWSQAPELPRTVQQELAARYHEAVGRIVATWPRAFRGHRPAIRATRKRMEKLVARVEELVPAQSQRRAQLSPAELLAQQWRERLAANTMSAGGATEVEDSRVASGRAGDPQRAGAVDASLARCRRTSPVRSTSGSMRDRSARPRLTECRKERALLTSGPSPVILLWAEHEGRAASCVLMARAVARVGRVWVATAPGEPWDPCRPRDRRVQRPDACSGWRIGQSTWARSIPRLTPSARRRVSSVGFRDTALTSLDGGPRHHHSIPRN
jgi:hypothetical protein